MRSEVNGQRAASCFLLTAMSRVSNRNYDRGLEIETRIGRESLKLPTNKKLRLKETKLNSCVSQVTPVLRFAKAILYIQNYPLEEVPKHVSMSESHSTLLYTRCKFPPVCNCGRGISLSLSLFSLNNKSWCWAPDEFSHYNKSHFNSLFVALFSGARALGSIFYLVASATEISYSNIPLLQAERLSVSATLTLFLPQALSTK